MSAASTGSATATISCWKPRWSIARSSPLASFVFCVLSMLLVFFLGQDFFPSVDAGLMRLHVRARAGLRVEETAQLCDEVEEYLRQQIPKDELVTILDNIGLPNSGINLSYSNSGVIGTSDAEILVGLNPEHHHPTAEYIRQLTRRFAAAISRRGVLLPAGRHRYADLEFRLARAHRYSADRSGHVRQLLHGTADRQPPAACAGYRRCTRAADARLADATPGHRTRPGDPGGNERARRRAKRAGFAERQFSDRAEFLAESDERRELSGCGAIAAISHDLAAGPDEHSG